MKAARSGGCALVLLGLVAAACGGGGAADTERAPATGEQVAATQPPVDATTETTPGEAAATDLEVAWVGWVIDWAIGIGAAVEFVQANGEALAEGKRPPRALGDELGTALRALAGCTSEAEEVGPPPSERLAPVQEAVRAACERYAAGASAALELLRGAEPGGRAAEWEAAWREGATLMGSLSEGIREFQPANTRTLVERTGVTQESRVEPEFGAVAGELVETDLEVRCWSPRDWKVLLHEMKRFTRGRIGGGTVGFAGYGDHRVNLAPEICDGLVALRYANARPQEGEELARVAIAVETLMHEAQHVRGVWNEPAAECYGMQMLREAAHALGAPRRYAARLAEFYWTELYALLPEGYRSDECRDGGALDADPSSPVWP